MVISPWFLYVYQRVTSGPVRGIQIFRRSSAEVLPSMQLSKIVQARRRRWRANAIATCSVGTWDLDSEKKCDTQSSVSEIHSDNVHVSEIMVQSSQFTDQTGRINRVKMSEAIGWKPSES